MDDKSTIQRTRIKQELYELLLEKFGPAGLVGQWFREVNRKQWRPGGKVRPSIWIVDAGCVRSSSKNLDDTTKAKILSLRLVLDLVSHFEREGTVDDWSDRVEQIGAMVDNFSPQCGVYRCEQIRDEPMDVVVQSGAIEAIWEIEFELEYFYEVRAFGPDVG